MTTTDPSTASTRRQPGPPLAPIAIVTMALFMMSLTIPLLLAGTTYPSPFGEDRAILDYFRQNTAATTITALLQFAAALPLAIYAAVSTTRLNRLGIRAPGVSIAFAGGILSSAAMTISAFASWGLTRPATLADDALVRTLHDLAFITGGPGAVVPLGLLVAGIAVPGLLAGLLPRWLAITGLVLAGIAVLGTLAVAVPALAVLLPIARFPSMVWLIIAALRLPKDRAPRNRTS